MGFGSLGGSGIRPTLRPPSLGPQSQRPDSARTAPQERRDIEMRARERAEASAPPFLTPIVWLGVIGLCLMAFDVIPEFGGENGGPTLLEIWARCLEFLLPTYSS